MSSMGIFGNTKASKEAVTAGLSKDTILEALGTIGTPVERPNQSGELLDDPNPMYLKTLNENPCLIRGTRFSSYIEQHSDPYATDKPVEYGSEEGGEIKVYNQEEMVGSGNEFDKLKDKVVEIVEVNETDKDRFLKVMDERREQVREFLLFDIAPLSMGTMIALDEFNQEMSLIMDENVQTNFNHLTRLMDEAILLKTYEFLVGKLNLSEENADRIVAHHLTKSLPNPSKDMMDRLTHGLRQQREGIPSATAQRPSQKVRL
ncbi:hypothetical protein GR11A_00001 [Vibrio phage vB_VcorM_GR11A]|nr:hypothetical protein GR11A_00001 [Vibrio phage vB_VcorM_GR11A]